MNGCRQWILPLALALLVGPAMGSSTAAMPSDSLIPPAADTAAADSLRPAPDASPADTTVIDSLPSVPGAPPADSAREPLIDTVRTKPVQYHLPMLFLDSVTTAFARFAETYDVRQNDLYPRNAAGFLASRPEYFVMTYHESPLRTTVQPFGLPGQQMTLFCGGNRLRPYDRVIPADGLIDFDDIATGDLEGARIVEGPIGGAVSPDGGLSLLYLQPAAIPQDKARSEFTVERGSYSYAYTRARVARMLSKRFGLFLSTDYRKAGSRFYGSDIGADDSGYCVKTQLLYHLAERTTFEFSLDAYRRTGGFPVQPDNAGAGFRRLQRDHTMIFTLTQHAVKGGQLAGKFEYQKSKSAYSRYGNSFYRTVTPRYYRGEVSYLVPRPGRLYELTVGGGKEKYTIDGLDGGRNYGFVSASALRDITDGKLYAMGRWRVGEREQVAVEGTAGLVKTLAPGWKGQASLGYLCRWPDVADRIAPERFGALGGYDYLAHVYEYGNPDLAMEKRLAGNAAVEYRTGRTAVSAAITGGVIRDLIYYDPAYDSLIETTFSPANDRVNFGDLSVSVTVDTVGPFYGMASAAVRKVDSDRWGNHPPYSPRWQVYTQLGLRHYLAKYKIHVRLFGDVAYTERPLSYRLAKLNTAAMVTGGFNLSLKDLTFYMMFHNVFDQYNLQPDGYGYFYRHYSWGFNWKFLD